MPNLFTVSPGQWVALHAAEHILGVLSPHALGRAVVFVPTRRAGVSMRQAFQKALAGKSALLPRILPLADSGEALLTLLGTEAVALLEQIPPAMPLWEQHYLLATQVRAFLQQRHGAVDVDYPLTLAEDLLTLEDECARAGVRLDPAQLRALAPGGMAEHWEQSLEFLKILAEQWPKIEQALGTTSATRREIRVMETLTHAWRAKPPAYPVFAVGSTASQESTAALLEAIANMDQGAVILPGLNPAIRPDEWALVEPGHPLFHLKRFLARFPAEPQEVQLLGETKTTLWQRAFLPPEHMLATRNEPPAPYGHLRLIPCAHPEEEARAISLLLREALETPGKRTALITPDEGLMTRVAAHMRRYGVTIDRLDQGTLAETPFGSLWLMLLTAIADPSRLLHLRSILQHPLIAIDRDLMAQLEPAWYGVKPRKPGELPKLPESIRMHPALPVVERLARALASLTRAEFLPSAWVGELERLLKPILAETAEMDERIAEILETFTAADMLGTVSVEECLTLLRARLSDAKRSGGVSAHPQLVMLTPLEARLECFDRVILASMTDDIWPAAAPQSAWLNLAAKDTLGLAPWSHHVSLIAHDVLMLGSNGEVFLTWPAQASSGPTSRSRFIERLVALLALHGVEEGAITAPEYAAWAEQLFKAEHFTPSLPPMPRPSATERPARLPVSAIDTLFTDPFAIYARYVLGLKPQEEMDAEAGASDFGSLTHKAIHALTQHWNTQNRPATEAEITGLAERALREFSASATIALFWRARLTRALGFVNEEEGKRRAQTPMEVAPELPIEKTLDLAEGKALTLHGRLDRLETGINGATIADYKTGDIPTAKKIEGGHATQLLAYALLMTDVHAIEYWRLPHAKEQGEISTLAYEPLAASGVTEALKAGLSQMLDETTPFLAMPENIRDYDGISRYDEWAGE